MDKKLFKIINLTSQDVLLEIAKLGLPFYESSRLYQVSATELRKSIENDQYLISKKICYLKKNGLVESFVEKKETFFKISEKGLDKIQMINFDEIRVLKPVKWDGKWRVVIFDIPEEHKKSRELLRNKLKEMGFEKLQNSVYVHPFECTKEISQISKIISEENNVLIMLADIIQGEENIILGMLDRGLLSKNDLK